MSITLYVVKTHPIVHLHVLLMILGGVKANFVPNKEGKLYYKDMLTFGRVMPGCYVKSIVGKVWLVLVMANILLSSFKSHLVSQVKRQNGLV